MKYKDSWVEKVEEHFSSAYTGVADSFEEGNYTDHSVMQCNHLYVYEANPKRNVKIEKEQLQLTASESV